jgi:serine phosphatase RsbU (regulator of sigma subunit)
VLAFVLYRNNRSQKRSNTLLTEQRNQLKERNFEIEQQNEEIKNKNNQIVSKNKKITESINYAQRIQQAILPDQTLIKTLLPDSFVYYRPYQIVSGDFYWFGVVDKKIIYAAIDCTGHGVPGAFMSMVGSALLNEIVNQNQITEPDLILKHLHIGIRDSLRQKDTHNQDGMDMAMVVIDTATQELHFAGAKNPLVYIQQGELHTIKGDRYPIGDVVINKDERSFTKHTIALDNTTVCYMFSDGYQDQFGGPDKRKFMGKRLRKMLLENHQLDFDKQKDIYEKTLIDWIGNTTQIDDVLLIGFRFDEDVPQRVLNLNK